MAKSLQDLVDLGVPIEMIVARISASRPYQSMPSCAVCHEKFNHYSVRFKVLLCMDCEDGLLARAP